MANAKISRKSLSFIRWLCHVHKENHLPKQTRVRVTGYNRQQGSRYFGEIERLSIYRRGKELYEGVEVVEIPEWPEPIKLLMGQVCQATGKGPGELVKAFDEYYAERQQSSEGVAEAPSADIPF